MGSSFPNHDQYDSKPARKNDGREDEKDENHHLDY